MNKIIHLFTCAAILSTAHTIVAMETTKMNLFVIPDSKDIHNNGDHAFNIFPDNLYNISRKIGTPFKLTFAYQNKKFYEDTIKQTINTADGPSFIYALGDGVPFALAYAVENPNKVAGILAEGTILTEQHYPFDLCTKISPDIPIMFFHNTNDSNSHINNMALYYHLKTTSRNKQKDLFTSYLDFTNADNTNNDYKNLPTNVIDFIHFFLQSHKLNNTWEQTKKLTNIRGLSKINPPNNKEQALLNALIKKETHRYYKDWATIIIPASLFVIMLSYLIYGFSTH